MKLDLVTRVLLKHHSIVLLAFCLLAIGFAYPAILYLPSTTLDMDPPKGSASAISLPIVNEVYPNITSEDIYMLMVDDRHNKVYSNQNPICSDETLLPLLEEFARRTNEVVASNEYFIRQNDYFQALTNYPLVKSQFCFNETFMIEIVLDSKYDGLKNAPLFSKQFKDIFSSLFKENYGFLELNQIDYYLLCSESSSGTAKDLLKLDTISITCGLIIVGLYLKSFKFLLISLLNLAISFSISFAISYFISFKWQIATFAPPVQSSALVALTFDYCLFLFSKLQSELANGKNPLQAVASMVQYSGHVVFVSGGCLSLVFLFLMLCAVELIQTIGLASSISIFVLMCVNTLNTAAILMTFPKFFMKEDYPFAAKDVIFKHFCRSKEEQAELLPKETQNEQEIDVEIIKFEDKKSNKFSKLLYETLQYITSRYWIMILLLIAIIALSLSFLPAFLNMKYSMDLTQAMPRNSPTIKGMNRLSEIATPGITNPFYIVLNKTGEAKDSLISKEVFEASEELIHDLIDNSTQFFNNDELRGLMLDSESIIAPCFAGADISIQEFKILNKTGSYEFLLNQTAPHYDDLSTFSLMIIPNISMSGKHSEIFIPWVRDIMQSHKEKFASLNITMSEHSILTTLTDSVSTMFKALPMIIGVSFGIMFIILAVTFRSLCSPLCFLLEVFLAMVFYYGVATYLFEYDHINNNDALFWATILVMFSISIGLCSDYYVFRFSGIYNEYCITHNAQTAVLDASENMSVVMTAGLIMIVSFSGLLFSSLDMLLEFGVCLVVSLAFDTLIVVPILVPSITIFLGKAMFWPGKKSSHPTEEYTMREQAMS